MDELKKKLDAQTGHMKEIRQLYEYADTYKSLKPVFDGLQKIKFAKSREKYKAEHAADLRLFYAARRKLTEEFKDGVFDRKKLSAEYSRLEQTHAADYAKFKDIRSELQTLWRVRTNIDTARRFDERTKEQTPQNRPQTRHKKEDISL